MSNCSGCGKEIKWIKLTSGKSNPVNPTLLVYTEIYKNPMVVSPSGEVGKLEKLREGYISHFSTCVKVKDFRKSRNKEV